MRKQNTKQYVAAWMVVMLLTAMLSTVVYAGTPADTKSYDFFVTEDGATISVILTYWTATETLPEEDPVFSDFASETGALKYTGIYKTLSRNENSHTWVAGKSIHEYNSENHRLTYYATFDLQKKSGKDVITYKYNGKQKKIKISLKSYENPIQTLKVKGIKEGKNLKSLTQKTDTAYVDLDKNISSSKITLKSAGRWKISSVSLDANDVGDYMSLVYNFEKPKTSFSLPVGGTLKKDRKYTLNICFVDEKTGDDNSIIYYINY